MYKNIWEHGYKCGAETYSLWAQRPQQESIALRAGKRADASQQLANKGYDLDMFERHLVGLAFDCGWADGEACD